MIILAVKKMIVNMTDDNILSGLKVLLHLMPCLNYRLLSLSL